MPVFILIPFATFFTCCILQFWYFKQVRDALIDRHPEAYLAAEKSSMFPYQGLRKFVRGDGYKVLHDSELSRHVRNLKRLNVVAIGSWVIFAIALLTAP